MNPQILKDLAKAIEEKNLYDVKLKNIDIRKTSVKSESGYIRIELKDQYGYGMGSLPELKFSSLEIETLGNYILNFLTDKLQCDKLIAEKEYKKMLIDKLV